MWDGWNWLMEPWVLQKENAHLLFFLTIFADNGEKTHCVVKKLRVVGLEKEVGA